MSAKEIRISGIQTAPTKGAPMEAKPSVFVVADVGIEDDRYATGTGAYSKSRRQNVPPELGQDRSVIRDVSFIARGAIRAANEGAEELFTFADTRRNVELDTDNDLRDLIGVYFWLGAVLFLGIEPCDPCDRPSSHSGKPGFRQQFANRGGLRARVVRGGLMQLADQLTIVPVADLEA